jgi:hypothetical protein
MTGGFFTWARQYCGQLIPWGHESIPPAIHSFIPTGYTPKAKIFLAIREIFWRRAKQ